MHAPHYSDNCDCRNCRAVRAQSGIEPRFECPRCGKQTQDGIEAGEHEMWHAKKDEGAKAGTLLNALPLGTEITLAQVGRAYSGTYRKNSEGLWDQVWAVEAPLVLNFDPAHLGFCVGYAAVQKAVRACPTL